MLVARGESDFQKLYGQGCVYVDKTYFLKKWWKGVDSITLITRPRRFGKTLTLSMIKYFFSPLYKGVTKADGSPLFEGLKVWEDEEMRSLQGTVPVISMTLSGAKSGTKKEMEELLSKQVRSQCRCYRDTLRNNGLLVEDDKELIRRYANTDYYDNPSKVFLDLCTVLQSAYGTAPILLLDEYDTPLTEAFLKGTLQEVIDPLRSFFVQCYKDNTSFSKCVITGITRIAQQSLFSDFNNPCIDTMLNSDYPALMGYTEEEVKTLLKSMGREDSLQEVKDKYDGYSIAGKIDIYNPYSLNMCLANNAMKTYWISTSQSALPKAIITEGAADMKEAIANLLSGEGVWTILPTNLIYENLYQNKDAALSLLFSGGYLKSVDHLWKDRKSTRLNSSH
mgnify:CR=1 FL=1